MTLAKSSRSCCRERSLSVSDSSLETVTSSTQQWGLGVKDTSEMTDETSDMALSCLDVGRLLGELRPSRICRRRGEAGREPSAAAFGWCRGLRCLSGLRAPAWWVFGERILDGGWLSGSWLYDGRLSGWWVSDSWDFDGPVSGWWVSKGRASDGRVSGWWVSEERVSDGRVSGWWASEGWASDWLVSARSRRGRPNVEQPCPGGVFPLKEREEEPIEITGLQIVLWSGGELGLGRGGGGGAGGGGGRQTDAEKNRVRGDGVIKNKKLISWFRPGGCRVRGLPLNKKGQR